MKIFKYLILAVLIVSLTKKIHVLNDTSYDFGSILYDSQTHMAFKSTDDGQQETFVGAIAVNPTVTPPNLSAPALTFIATITADPNRSNAGYGSSNKRNVFGVMVHGDPIPVLDSTTDQTIGFYWDQDKIVAVAQLPIFVAIMQQALTPKQGFYALGPTWTWFDTPTSHQELARYGISIKQFNFKDLVTQIGYIVKNQQKYILHGVKFDPRQEQEKPVIIKQLLVQEARPIEHETQIPSMDTMTKKLRKIILP